MDLVSEGSEIDEATFIDEVSRNLRCGWFLLVIVGDGIREEVASLAEYLQQHAGFHFALQLVELALFAVPDGGYIAHPRLLAKTVNIERGVVRIEDGSVSVEPAKASLVFGSPTPYTTITRE